METIFIDSNIWCYYLDPSAKEHEAASREVKRALKESNHQYGKPTLKSNHKKEEETGVTIASSDEHNLKFELESSLHSL